MFQANTSANTFGLSTSDTIWLFLRRIETDAVDWVAMVFMNDQTLLLSSDFAKHIVLVVWLEMANFQYFLSGFECTYTSLIVAGTGTQSRGIYVSQSGNCVDRYFHLLKVHRKWIYEAKIYVYERVYTAKEIQVNRFVLWVH